MTRLGPMPLAPGYRLRDASVDDLDAIAELRRSVDWAAHEWALRVVLDPPARCLVADGPEGDVVAVGSGIAYGHLGFVGNMVVAEGHRRAGLGTAILAEVIAFLEGRGCRRLELYATAQGRPLYERHGFRLVEPSALARVERRHLADGSPASDSAPVAVATLTGAAGMIHALAAFDAPRFGDDRQAVLDALPVDAGSPLLVATRSDDVVGYAWVRAEHGRIGPFVADDPSVAEAIVRAALAAAPASAGLTFNITTTNRPGMGWLEGLGVELEPWDGRMARGAASRRRDEAIYGNALGALG
jgi:GNAT superfamily N-acetyltransferase